MFVFVLHPYCRLTGLLEHGCISHLTKKKGVFFVFLFCNKQNTVSVELFFFAVNTATFMFNL